MPADTTKISLFRQLLTCCLSFKPPPGSRFGLNQASRSRRAIIASMSSPIEPRGSLLQRLAFAATAVAAMLALSGCAALLGINALSQVVHGIKGPVADESREREANRQVFPYAVAQVYEALLHVVERDDRKIVDQDPVAHTLRVSYPFSWLHNNWGGFIKIACVANAENGSAGSTTVTVVGGARDASWRIRALGNQVLADLASSLDQQH
ncbi:MAG: hypothetical protein ABI564_16320 [Ideonella sp.]